MYIFHLLCQYHLATRGSCAFEKYLLSWRVVAAHLFAFRSDHGRDGPTWAAAPHVRACGSPRNSGRRFQFHLRQPPISQIEGKCTRSSSLSQPTTPPYVTLISPPIFPLHRLVSLAALSPLLRPPKGRLRQAAPQGNPTPRHLVPLEESRSPDSPCQKARNSRPARVLRGQPLRS